MSLGWRGGGKTGWGAGGKSKGCTLPMAGELGDQVLLAMAEGLLRGIEDWPCANLSLTLGGFEETEGGRGIMGFLVKGDAAKVGRDERSEGGQKRRKIEGENKEGISRFFTVGEERDGADDGDEGIENASHSDFEVDDLLTHPHPPPEPTTLLDLNPTSPSPPQPLSKPLPKTRFFTQTQPPKPSPPSHLQTTPSNPEPEAKSEATPKHPCPKCRTLIPITKLSEHEDWHFAKELVEEERRAVRAAAAPLQTTQSNNHGRWKRKGNSSGGDGAGGGEKGQRKLPFGK